MHLKAKPLWKVRSGQLNLAPAQHTFVTTICLGDFLLTMIGLPLGPRADFKTTSNSRKTLLSKSPSVKVANLVEVDSEGGRGLTRQPVNARGCILWLLRRWRGKVKIWKRSLFSCEERKIGRWSVFTDRPFHILRVPKYDHRQTLYSSGPSIDRFEALILKKGRSTWTSICKVISWMDGFWGCESGKWSARISTVPKFRFSFILSLSEHCGWSGKAHTFRVRVCGSKPWQCT